MVSGRAIGRRGSASQVEGSPARIGGARTCLAALLVLACGCDGGTAPPSGPTILESSVTPNPWNAISAVVTVGVEGADSVAVRFGIEGGPLDGATPAAAPSGEAAVVPVLGLIPGTDYRLQALAWGRGRSVEGPQLTFSTGTLPEDLPSYQAGGSDPSPGYLVLAAGPYGIVIDNDARVVWYRRFERELWLNFQAQPNGRYTAPLRPLDPWGPVRWVEVDALGNETRALGCARGLRARLHDLLAETDGSYWILCDETRPMDLSVVGGVAEALVTGTVVQRVSGSGDLLYEWSSFDHFAITDVEEAERTGPVVNWTHGNALDLDADGNLLISFRNLSEITKVDSGTGEVLWRMGGIRNEFTFQGGLTPPFARQHSVRATGPGRLILLDNLGAPGESRARRFVYDEEARTARLAGSVGSLPPVVAWLGGSVQELPGERLLVSFGNGERVEEYDAEGRVAWQLEAPGYVFRAQRIASLYRPGINTSR